MSETGLEYLQEFLDAHLTFIVRNGRIEQDRAATLSDLQDFILENASWLCQQDLIGILQDISRRLLNSNMDAVEVNQQKLENVFGMMEKVKDEICILEAEVDGG